MFKEMEQFSTVDVEDAFVFADFKHCHLKCDKWLLITGAQCHVTNKNGGTHGIALTEKKIRVDSNEDVRDLWQGIVAAMEPKSPRERSS